jgi:hypothetical protein
VPDAQGQAQEMWREVLNTPNLDLGAGSFAEDRFLAGESINAQAKC